MIDAAGDRRTGLATEESLVVSIFRTYPYNARCRVTDNIADGQDITTAHGLG